MPWVLFQGEKIFYLIKPTKTNLALYESWSSSANQSEVFFGDKVEKCYKCVVTQGSTVLLPTGQISLTLLHVCVWTSLCLWLSIFCDVLHIHTVYIHRQCSHASWLKMSV